MQNLITVSYQKYYGSPLANLSLAIDQAELRRLFANEESKEIFPHKVTAAVFIRMGLDVEEHQ